MNMMSRINVAQFVDRRDHFADSVVDFSSVVNAPAEANAGIRLPVGQA